MGEAKASIHLWHPRWSHWVAKIKDQWFRTVIITGTNYNLEKWVSKSSRRVRRALQKRAFLIFEGRKACQGIRGKEWVVKGNKYELPKCEISAEEKKCIVHKQLPDCHISALLAMVYHSLNDLVCIIMFVILQPSSSSILKPWLFFVCLFLTTCSLTNDLSMCILTVQTNPTRSLSYIFPIYLYPVVIKIFIVVHWIL